MRLPSRIDRGPVFDALAALGEVTAALRATGSRRDRLERITTALCRPPVAHAVMLEADPAGRVAHVLARTSVPDGGKVSQTAGLARFSSGISRAIATAASVDLARDGTLLLDGHRGVSAAALAQPILGARTDEVLGVILAVLVPGAEVDRRLRTLLEVVASMVSVLFVREADRSATAFLSTISHELRTPLQAILGWAEVLGQAGAGSEAWGRGVRAIGRNARIEAALVDDLLDSARLARGGLRLGLAPVRVLGAVEQAVRSLEPEAKEKGISLSLEAECDSCEVLGDGDRLERVFHNLVSNALKFTPAGGRVSVTVDHLEGLARVRVRDSGQGIPASLLPHVFEAFWQSEGTETRTHGGLGLGLPMVRHVLELHGGTVRAESAGPGRGATFTVEIPLLGTASVPLDRAGLLDGLRILVIEDDDDVREAVASALASFGADVLVAASAHEALAVLERGPEPDVVVSDIRLPDEDGYSLIRKLRGMAASTPPALALTALSSSLDRERALAAGFQAHVPKPVHAAELARTVAFLSGRGEDWRRPGQGSPEH